MSEFIHHFEARQDGEAMVSFSGPYHEALTTVIELGARHTVAGPVTIYEGWGNDMKPILELRKPDAGGVMQTISFESLRWIWGGMTGRTGMRLWLLERRDDRPAEPDPWAPQWDTATGVVVRAETEAQARSLADSCRTDENMRGIRPWLLDQYTSCTELTADGEPEILLIDGISG